MKALGKPAPKKHIGEYDNINCSYGEYCSCKEEHYKTALIEAAEVLEAGFDTRTPRRNLAKMLRISAGVKEVDDCFCQGDRHNPDCQYYKDQQKPKASVVHKSQSDLLEVDE